MPRGIERLVSRRGMAGIGTGLRRRPRAKWAGHRACGRVVTTLIYVFKQINNIVLERHWCLSRLPAGRGRRCLISLNLQLIVIILTLSRCILGTDWLKKIIIWVCLPCASWYIWWERQSRGDSKAKLWEGAVPPSQESKQTNTIFSSMHPNPACVPCRSLYLTELRATSPFASLRALTPDTVSTLQCCWWHDRDVC